MNKKMRSISLAAAPGLLALLVTAACGSIPPASSVGRQGAIVSSPSLPRDSGLSMNIIVHADRFVMDTPQLMCAAALVADVTVASLQASQWNTATGTLPAGATKLEVESQGYEIYTPVVWSQQSILLDHRTVATREFVLAGGRVGSAQITEDDFPQLAAGARYLVAFLPGQSAGPSAVSPQTMLAFDAFPIDAAGNVDFPATSSNGTGQDTPQSASPLPLAQVAQQLQNCAN